MVMEGRLMRLREEEKESKMIVAERELELRLQGEGTASYEIQRHHIGPTCAFAIRCPNGTSSEDPLLLIEVERAHRTDHTSESGLVRGLFVVNLRAKILGARPENPGWSGVSYSLSGFIHPDVRAG